MHSCNSSQSELELSGSSAEAPETPHRCLKYLKSGRKRSESPSITVGSKVTAQGLKAFTTLNGAMGIVSGVKASEDRYVVDFLSVKVRMSLDKRNLTLVSSWRSSPLREV